MKLELASFLEEKRACCLFALQLVFNIKICEGGLCQPSPPFPPPTSTNLSNSPWMPYSHATLSSKLQIARGITQDWRNSNVKAAVASFLGCRCK